MPLRIKSPVGFFIRLRISVPPILESVISPGRTYIADTITILRPRIALSTTLTVPRMTFSRTSICATLLTTWMFSSWTRSIQIKVNEKSILPNTRTTVTFFFSSFPLRLKTWLFLSSRFPTVETISTELSSLQTTTTFYETTDAAELIPSSRFTNIWFLNITSFLIFPIAVSLLRITLPFFRTVTACDTFRFLFGSISTQTSTQLIVDTHTFPFWLFFLKTIISTIVIVFSSASKTIAVIVSKIIKCSVLTTKSLILILTWTFSLKSIPFFWILDLFRSRKHPLLYKRL